MRDLCIRQAGTVRLPAGRHLGFIFVAAMHAALIWLAAGNLEYVRLVLDVPREPFVGKVIELVQPLPHEPVIVPSSGGTGVRVDDLLPPPISFPTDELSVPPDQVADAGSAVGTKNVVREPVLRGPRVDPAKPLTQPDYPLASIRADEQGTVTLELLVGLDGRVLDARIVGSSGYPRLDAAARTEATRRWRLEPATLDGRPVERWHRLKVVFNLDRR